MTTSPNFVFEAILCYIVVMVAYAFFFRPADVREALARTLPKASWRFVLTAMGLVALGVGLILGSGLLLIVNERLRPYSLVGQAVGILVLWRAYRYSTRG
jgi:hypothetical protein